MTNKEAINFMGQIKAILLSSNSWLESTREPINEAFDLAISAVEKQIPKKPLPKELAEQQPFGNNPVYVIPCGSCGEPLNFLFPYCPWCGQKVDWTEDEG